MPAPHVFNRVNVPTTALAAPIRFLPDGRGPIVLETPAVCSGGRKALDVLVELQSALSGRPLSDDRSE